ncbi:hypothetical protein BX666DRAFT_1225139 [Dichotomocladium elegans]|nr:hypothetical protein BX666DRAFT_1225139 [Dichotomocladium elegans]
MKGQNEMPSHESSVNVYLMQVPTCRLRLFGGGLVDIYKIKRRLKKIVPLLSRNPSPLTSLSCTTHIVAFLSLYFLLDMPPKRLWQEAQSYPDPSVLRSSRESRKCNVCRRRHVKCDEQRPKCSNCLKANAECSYSHSGMRYDHISDRQKRDDIYTEIGDISNRVDSLLVGIQNQVNIHV